MKHKYVLLIFSNTCTKIIHCALCRSQATAVTEVNNDHFWWSHQVHFTANCTFILSSWHNGAKTILKFHKNLYDSSILLMKIVKYLVKSLCTYGNLSEISWWLWPHYERQVRMIKICFWNALFRQNIFRYAEEIIKTRIFSR